MWACGRDAVIRGRAHRNCESPRRATRRTLLVQGAHHQPPGAGYRSETMGTAPGETSGKRGKKRAVVAVARKLGILLHRLWVTGEVYEPLRNHNLRQEKKKIAA